MKIDKKLDPVKEESELESEADKREDSSSDSESERSEGVSAVKPNPQPNPSLNNKASSDNDGWVEEDGFKYQLENNVPPSPSSSPKEQPSVNSLSTTTIIESGFPKKEKASQPELTKTVAPLSKKPQQPKPPSSPKEPPSGIGVGASGLAYANGAKSHGNGFSNAVGSNGNDADY